MQSLMKGLRLICQLISNILLRVSGAKSCKLQLAPSLYVISTDAYELFQTNRNSKKFNIFPIEFSNIRFVAFTKCVGLQIIPK